MDNEMQGSTEKTDLKIEKKIQGNQNMEKISE